MKKLVFIIATLYQSILSIQAQETETRSPFLFDEYKEGIVVLENRTQVKGKLNLYLPTGDFFFIDTTDGNKEKVLAKPEEVALIRFGSRIFIPSEDGGWKCFLQSLCSMYYTGQACATRVRMRPMAEHRPWQTSRATPPTRVAQV